MSVGRDSLDQQSISGYGKIKRLARVNRLSITVGKLCVRGISIKPKKDSTAVLFRDKGYGEPTFLNPPLLTPTTVKAPGSSVSSVDLISIALQEELSLVPTRVCKERAKEERETSFISLHTTVG